MSEVAIVVEGEITQKKRGRKPNTETIGSAPAVHIKSGVEDVEFFGNVDINKHGRRGSEMPAWYFRSQKDDIENNLAMSEASIQRGEISEDRKPQMLADIRRMREKLDAINESQPQYDSKKQDAIAKMTDTLGKKISESMYTRSDMMRGVADAHEEARRMSEPCIKLEGDEYLLAKKAGCRVSSDGKVSRIDAERVWKMGRRALGENSNSEVLRRQQ